MASSKDLETIANQLQLRVDLANVTPDPKFVVDREGQGLLIGGERSYLGVTADRFEYEQLDPALKEKLKEPVHNAMYSGTRSMVSVSLGGKILAATVSPFRSTSAYVETFDITDEENRRQWEYAATHDPLTGVLNRTALKRDLPSRLDELQRLSGDEHSICMWDIDHFKKVNDTYGHNTGDKVLCHFADILESESRDIDTVYRFGGEEFVVLLPHTDVDKAYQAMERTRTKVEQGEVPIDDRIIKITASGGIAGTKTMGRPSDSQEPFEKLLADADTALYRSKVGRNQITIYTPTLG